MVERKTVDRQWCLLALALSPSRAHPQDGVLQVQPLPKEERLYTHGNQSGKLVSIFSTTFPLTTTKNGSK